MGKKDTLVSVPVSFTDEEKKIVKGIADGWTVKKIAIDLRQSSGVINSKIMSIRMRLGAANSAHLVALFFRHKLID